MKAENSVVVAGAGPVGLAAALSLRSFGHSVKVLEKDPEDRERPGSRALYLHRQSLEILGRLDPVLAKSLEARGIQWTDRTARYKGREIFRKTYAPPKPGVPRAFASLRQVETEYMLREACDRAGIEILWNAPVERVTLEGDYVGLVTPKGTTNASYLVAADGARSVVREAIGSRFDGPRDPGTHVVVDIEEVGNRPFQSERCFHYLHPALQGRNVLTVPFAGGIQVDLQCRQSDDPLQFVDEHALQTWITKVIPEESISKVLWKSTYEFRRAVATSFIDTNARVLLVGEAAHLFPPFGARGLNSGIADAYAAASAITNACQANNESLRRASIEDFGLRRRDAALFNQAAAQSALAHMRSGTQVIALKKSLAARFSRAVPAAGRWMDEAVYGPRGGVPSGRGYY